MAGVNSHPRITGAGFVPFVTRTFGPTQGPGDGVLVVAKGGSRAFGQLEECDEVTAG